MKSRINGPVTSVMCLLCVTAGNGLHAQDPPSPSTNPQVVGARARVSLNDGWKFYKYADAADADALIYDVRPEVTDTKDDRPADTEPTEAEKVAASDQILKPWILPSGNAFVADPNKRHKRPGGNPGGDFPYVQNTFADSEWQTVDLPHDWAIAGPFMEGWDVPVTGGMGRLPSPGVGWYRRKLDIPAEDLGKSIFLDIDGAMSYAMVWMNGKLVGGWPFGYSSFRLDLTPYVKPGGENQLAIRLDNPPNSSRWYPGGGLYRNVWLTTTQPVHVAQWGTFVRTPDVSKQNAEIDYTVVVDNDGERDAQVEVSTRLFELASDGTIAASPVGRFESTSVTIAAGQSATVESTTQLQKPKLWGPPPTQTPNRYVAVTQVTSAGELVDTFETRFGIRKVEFDANRGVIVNGEHIPIQGVNQHHDLGALGAAFNVRAAQRQLELLQEMGCNAIRMAHNPPAPELLELTDQMGFLVVDELYDVFARKKTPLDFHLIFPDWHEQDLRSLIRRDRNHPSVILWSTGNELGEQYTGDAGAELCAKMRDICKQEDPTRSMTASMNYAKPDMAYSEPMDVISLNYQGEGIRNAPAYKHLEGINTPPLYPAFHQKYPDKLILSSENAAAVSSRGTYLFPVARELSAPIADGAGGDPNRQYVSAYELYTAPFGSSADKVLGSLEKHPYVGGGFVWSGWDYLGEPTPYYGARSSYFGVIDLAGFKKDRFYLYQSHWRAEHPMVHVLPHWTWPDRVGKKTPVHVFTSGNEVELFLNGKSLGRKTKQQYQYRLRWDDVVYEPGELQAVAFKDGKPWSSTVVNTAGQPAEVRLTVDRKHVRADGTDLCFVTARIVDSNGTLVPQADNELKFQVAGPGRIEATDNGDPTCFVEFPSATRPAFNGLCLAIVRTRRNEAGEIRISVTSGGLPKASIAILAAPIAANLKAVVTESAD
ncbi:MAG: beta-galactosidase GalB [Pirellulaceae bacterium]